MTSPILPGSVVGVLGSGQLGRMFAIAARQLGYRVHTYSPETDTPTGQVADVECIGPYDDLAAIEKFAASVNVVTFEFENIPVEAVEAAAKHAPIRPNQNALFVSQHRLREKAFLAKSGFPVAPFQKVRSAEEARTAVAKVGLPAVLKTAGFGYDGKGQRRIATAEEAVAAFQALAAPEAVLEAFIPFEREVSVVAARGLNGDVRDFGVMENRHSKHILDVTLTPSNLPSNVVSEARAIACAILEELDVVGVMCVEFFLTKDHQLLVNETAPRPHNSGHLTIDACATSQFEQQLRAVCGLPLGETTLIRPAAMANLLGEVWADGEPNWAAALAMPGVKIHLYGKQEPRVGRKMGHITAFGATADEAARTAVAAREALLS